MKKLILTVLAIVAMAGATVNADTLLYEDFNSYSGTTGGFAQFDTGLELAHSGGVGGWDVFGTNTMHAVDLANLVGESNPSNWAIMLHSGTSAGQENVITRFGLNANTSGESYEVNFDYGTGAWAGGQETGAADGLLVEVLRTDNTVLASGIFMPGVWGAGNYNLDAGLQGTLTYVGDGTGNVRLQISPSNPHNNHWSGTIDNIEILGPPAPPPPFTGFTENFNGYWGTQNTTQVGTGLNLAHSGGVDGWGRSGGGTMHAVDLGSSNWAIMLWADNVITRYGLNANDLGETYELTFDYGTAVYAVLSQATGASDGLLVEVLRTDNTVLASEIFTPGAWGETDPNLPGDPNLHPHNYNLDFGLNGTLTYTGDGTGLVSLRIGPSIPQTISWSGTIDNIEILGPPAPPPPFTGFTENFNGYWGTQNTTQVGTGLNLAHSGGVDGWGRSGGGTMHAVDLGSSNWAIMLWADNVITRYGLNANDLGETYELTFDYGTAVYAVLSQATGASDGLLVEVLRTDNTVLASEIFTPGAWGAGNYNLDGGHQGSLVYAGDGSGVVNIRIGPSSSGTFAGEIDNVALDFTELIAVNLAAPTPITWSGMSTALVADVATDPNGQLNYTWYAEPDGSGDPNLTVTITPDAGDNSAATIEVINDAPTGEVVNITVTVVVEEGTAIEGTSTPVTIDVYDTACLAAREGLGLSSTTDLVVNCKTDLADFAEIAEAWLENYAPDAPQPRP